MANVFEEKSTVERWDEEYYQPIALKLYDWAIADMLRLMEVEANATVLDAGCGPGVHSIRVARAGHRVCAIDISDTMLSQARERVAAQKLTDRVEFSQKDLTKLDFPDASFRYVFSWGVVIHIPNADKALDELARIIEPGGKLALYITNKTAVDHKVEALIRLIIRKPGKGLQRLALGDGNLYDMKNEKIWVWRFDAKAISDYLSAKGFNRVHRRIGELSEVQRFFGSGPIRNLLLRFNNLAYRLNLPAGLAASQLLVFEKVR